MLRERRRRTKAHAATVEPTPAPLLCTVSPREDYDRDAEQRVLLMKRVRLPMLLYLGALHALGMYWAVHAALGADTKCAATYAFGTFMYAVGGLGITARAHRLSHLSDKAAYPLSLLFLLLNSVANQGSPVHWSRDHRTHHLSSNSIVDPLHALQKHMDLWFNPLVLRAADAGALALGRGHVEHVHGVRRDEIPHDAARDVEPEQHRAQLEPQTVHLVAAGARARAGRDAHALGPLLMTREDTTTDSVVVLLVALGEGW